MGLFFFLLFNSSKLVRCSMLLKLQLLLLECFSFRPWHCSQYLLLRKKKTLKSQHHISGFLWAVFLWKCRWQKSSLFPSVDLWFVRSWSRILQFLLGPNWPPWLALCKDVFGYGHTTVSNMCNNYLRLRSASLSSRFDLQLVIVMTWICLHFWFQLECY